jgi:hypothetical protein
MSVRVCVQLNVFDLITKNGIVSATEIARINKADEILIRMLYSNRLGAVC